MERKEEGETAKMDRNPGAPPLYAQLEQILKQQIECGTYKKGDFLPTEKELMEKYELSRVTVRQAMTNLVQSGYARARRGIGTGYGESSSVRQRDRDHHYQLIHMNISAYAQT